MRDSRFDVLFEPVKIGPVTAPNRFYQVPHCTGMGWAYPQSLAGLREVKAEGGWGVVNTEYCSIHESSDDQPYPYCSLWDEGDVRNHAVMTEKVHAHGALAGVELWYGGNRVSNLMSRAAPLGLDSLPVNNDPLQAQRMDLGDFADLRRWHRDAARRAVSAGFDIVYVYAAHTYLLSQFLDPVLNTRTDAYGGPLKNRARLVRELLEETREAVGDTCAVALRIEVDNEDGGTDDRDELFAMLAPLTDLFDVTVSDYSRDMGASRFVKEADLETAVAHVRALTGKPVVSVGRFTSPETMLAQVRRGVLDFIGAARPSIADPFLPAKIRDGRMDEIRECIGCNVCYAGDARGVPIRCTQNPTIGEEWRRGWHPERFAKAAKPAKALVVGAGPAGLEAALTLARRGHEVMLAEATAELGGRVSREARLPGLAEWIRVRDHRVHLLSQMGNVEIYRESPLSAADVAATGAEHVLVATGSSWRRDGRGRTSFAPVPGLDQATLMTPDDILAGARPPHGPVVVHDDDGYVMAAAIAELLAREGHAVTYVASDARVSFWTVHTVEHARVHRRLSELGVAIVTNEAVTASGGGAARLTHVLTGSEREIACGTLVSVTSREPDEALYHALAAEAGALASLVRIGDCRAPGLIAMAVYDGHAAGRAIGAAEGEVFVKRDRVVMG